MWKGVARGFGLGAALLLAVLGCEGETPKESKGSTEDCSNGSPCVNNDDCPGGTRCSGDTCTRLFCIADGVTCSTNDVCASRECVTSPGGRVCWSGPRAQGWSCVDDVDCIGELVCDSGECSAAVAALGIAPSTLEFSMVEGEMNPFSKSLTIGNSGTAPLVFVVSAADEWLSVDVLTERLAPNSEMEVMLAVNGAGLATGEHQTRVTVEAEGAVGSPAQSFVTFSIVPAPSCTGTPTPCAGRTTLACTDGCEIGLGCLGATAIDCTASPANLDCTFCNSIVGCACDGASDCVEAPDEGPATCASQTNQTTCSQFSCSWGSRCTGTPTPCEDYDNAACEEIAGCTLG